MTYKTTGILTVATNNYIEYWKELALSLNRQNVKHSKITLHVFTDQALLCQEFAKRLNNLTVVTYEIENYGWPEATLLRYKIYSRFAHQIKDEILVHLDADMLVQKDIDFEIEPNEWFKGMAFVYHPGYYRASQMVLHFLRNYNFMQVARLVYRRIRLGGFGAWETNRNSLAFVDRKKRKNYCCGGAWFGLNENFFSFCKTLEERISNDSEKGVIAVWHDESHLNWFVSNQPKASIFSSKYCYDARYDFQQNGECIILAVDKDLSRKI